MEEGFSLYKFTFKKLKELEFAPKSYEGQNFLVSDNALKRIISESKINYHDTIIEVGSGLGILTELMAKLSKRVISFEKDKKLFDFLKKNLDCYKNLELINCDFLKYDLLILEAKSPVKIVSNLPYSIASQVILKNCWSSLPIELCLYMVQREVAERITARPHTKTYGILSVFIQLYGDCKIVKNYNPQAFYPMPKVESSLIKIVPFENKNYNFVNDKRLKKIVKAAFQQRRKKCYNSIENTFKINNDSIKNALLDAGVRLDSRAEDISPQQYIRLTEEFVKCGII